MIGNIVFKCGESRAQLLSLYMTKPFNSYLTLLDYEAALRAELQYFEDVRSKEYGNVKVNVVDIEDEVKNYENVVIAGCFLKKYFTLEEASEIDFDLELSYTIIVLSSCNEDAPQLIMRKLSSLKWREISNRCQL